jgi:hypothetical protein
MRLVQKRHRSSPRSRLVHLAADSQRWSDGSAIMTCLYSAVTTPIRSCCCRGGLGPRCSSGCDHDRGHPAVPCLSRSHRARASRVDGDLSRSWLVAWLSRRCRSERRAGSQTTTAFRSSIAARSDPETSDANRGRCKCHLTTPIAVRCSASRSRREPTATIAAPSTSAASNTGFPAGSKPRRRVRNTFARGEAEGRASRRPNAA